MAKETVKMIVTGHVDHGKSTLIGRLLLGTGSLSKERMAALKKIAKELGRDAQLAYLTDQLREERDEERTIDTTQVFFKTRKRNYVIIDVPGHVEFLRNMITGTTCADTAMLIADIHSGIQEQTKRHAYITDMLGVKSRLVVCNKMDLINYGEAGFLRLKDELLTLLASLGTAPSFIIPVSAKDDDNISRPSARMRWYKGPCLIEALDSLRTTGGGPKGTFAFSIQDVYTVDGEKTAIGKVLSGTIRRGQEVKLFPHSGTARIKAIKTFGKLLRAASAGENVGLVLDDGVPLKRGVVIVEKTSGLAPADRFKANVFWMANKPLETGKPLTLRCSTQEVTCVAERIEERINSSTFEIVEKNPPALGLNEAGAVIFKTDAPVVVESFKASEELGKFVLERGLELCGAGIIAAPLRQNHIP